MAIRPRAWAGQFPLEMNWVKLIKHRRTILCMHEKKQTKQMMKHSRNQRKWEQLEKEIGRAGLKKNQREISEIKDIVVEINQREKADNRVSELEERLQWNATFDKAIKRDGFCAYRKILSNQCCQIWLEVRLAESSGVGILRSLCTMLRSVLLYLSKCLVF